MTDANTQVLADPSAHTVEDVTAAFKTATPDQILAAQALERDGKKRSTITDYQVPAEQVGPPAVGDEFDRGRVLDINEGPTIVGEIPSLGRLASYPEIVGALHGNDAETFTRDEVRNAVEAFLIHDEQVA